MADNSPKRKLYRWLPLAIIAGGLLLWGGMFALGAYLELGSERPAEDSSRALLKGLITIGCTLAFLAFWGIALWNRSRRLRRMKQMKNFEA
jgi:hypothetical protein